MIKFRQKDFIAFLPALVNGAMIGGTALSIKQGSDQAKQMKEQAEVQEEQNREITSALNRIAKNADKNPLAAKQAAAVMEQKQYAAINRGTIKGISEFAKNAKGFGKDLGKVIWKRKNTLIGGVMAGGTLAGSSYLADKFVQKDMKKSGMTLPRQQVIQQKQYTSVGGILKATGKTLKGAAKKNKLLIGSMAAFGALPVVTGYAANKQQLKDQINATQEQPKQRSYSIMNLVKGVGKSLRTRGRAVGQSVTKTGQSMKKGWNNFKSHPGQSSLGWISNNIAFAGGRKGVAKFGQDLSKQGIKSGNKFTKAAGDFIQTHPKTALAASIPVGLGTMSLTWDKGEKLTKKGLKKLDKNAYAYQDSQNQEVQQ